RWGEALIVAFWVFGSWSLFSAFPMIWGADRTSVSHTSRPGRPTGEDAVSRRRSAICPRRPAALPAPVDRSEFAEPAGCALGRRGGVRFGPAPPRQDPGEGSPVACRRPDR